MPADTTAKLFERLCQGWSAVRPAPAQAFVQTWRERLATVARNESVDDDLLGFASELPGVHLLGADDVHVLVSRRADPAVVQEWRRRAVAPRRLLLACVLDPDALPAARERLGRDRSLALSRKEMQSVFEAGEPGQVLKTLLVERIPRRFLIPFNYLRPATGNLFFGRAEELDRLLQEEDVSFVIAGPGRIGKTSLLKQYRRMLLSLREARRSFEVDFYACSDTSPQAVARFFAMQIEPSSHSHRLTEEELVNFLRYLHHKHGGPLDLILDEVDAVCQTSAFRYLGVAAKQGYCRLVLSGRGELFRMMVSATSPLGCRLELVRPGALDPEAAAALLLRPLADLGVDLEDAEQAKEKVFRLTGRLPHLLQFYGKKLAELAAHEAASSISARVIDDLSWDLDSAYYVTSPLRELDDRRLRRLALAILREQPAELSVAAGQELAERHGLKLTREGTLDLLNQLVISNVLAWRRGNFGLANEALPTFAEKLGYFEDDSTESWQRTVLPAGGRGR